jgi:hypothetical protein
VSCLTVLSVLSCCGSERILILMCMCMYVCVCVCVHVDADDGRGGQHAAHVQAVLGGARVAQAQVSHSKLRRRAEHKAEHNMYMLCCAVL